MNKEKLILPISIMMGCIILGGFYYAGGINKRVLYTPSNESIPPSLIKINNSLLTKSNLILSATSSKNNSAQVSEEGSITTNVSNPAIDLYAQVGSSETRPEYYYSNDSETIYSQDNRYEAFIRTYYSASSLVLFNELWVVNIQSNDKQLVASSLNLPSPYNKGESTLIQTGQNAPLFATDDSRLYFMTGEWVTSSAILYYDTVDKNIKFLSAGDGLGVVTKGKYSGSVITNIHKYYSAPQYGSYDDFYILNANGKELADVGTWEQATQVKLTYGVIGSVMEVH
jgi:hypothetical protein